MMIRLCQGVGCLLVTGLLMGSPCIGGDGGGDDGGDDTGDDGADGDDGDGGDGAGGDRDGDGIADADDPCPIDPTAGDACQLTEACAITGDADGTPLAAGDTAEAHAGSYVTLEPSAACGQDFDTEWHHGIAPDVAIRSREREDFFLLYGPETVEMRVLREGRTLWTQSVSVTPIEVPVAASMLVEPIKPRTIEQPTVTVSAILDGAYVPLTSVPGVVAVDYELLRLEAFLPVEVLLEAPGQTTSSLVLPAQPVGWYQVRAVGRDAAGEIVATPLPATFEFVR